MKKLRVEGCTEGGGAHAGKACGFGTLSCRAKKRKMSLAWIPKTRNPGGKSFRAAPLPSEEGIT